MGVDDKGEVRCVGVCVCESLSIGTDEGGGIGEGTYMCVSESMDVGVCMNV